MRVNLLKFKSANSNLEEKTYTRRYTYGQGTALKFLVGRFLKKLDVNKSMHDVVLNKTETGDHGYPDTYRVRIRWNE